MEKNRSFKHFFARIALGLALVATPMSFLNASFYNATRMTKAMPNNEQCVVHLISDVHMKNARLDHQPQALLHEIEKDPKNSCVVLEVNASCITDDVAQAMATKQPGIFCYLGNECARRGIEMANVEFRVHADEETGRITSLTETPWEISIVDFVKIVAEELKNLKEADLLQPIHIGFWNKLLSVCQEEELLDGTVEDLYIYCDEQHARGQKIMPTEEIVGFFDSLIDLKIINAIQKTNKNRIFVVAGGYHLKNVQQYLLANGYEVCSESGITLTQAAEFHNQTNVTEVAQAIPLVNMADYFNDIAETTTNSMPKMNDALLMWQPFILV
jgi:hypothetical protein